MKILLFISVFVFFVPNSFAGSFYTICDGYWNDSTVWLGANLPTTGDSIFINNNIRLNTSNLILNNNYLNISVGSELCGDSLHVVNGSYVVVEGTAKFFSWVWLNGPMIVNGNLFTNLISVNGGGSLQSNGNVVVGWSGNCAIQNPCVPPIVNFGISDSTVCEGECITFNDSSSLNPTNWNWYITGPASFFSSNQNLVICFTIPGIYSVKLVVSNAIGADSILVQQLITVNSISNSTINQISCNNYTSPSGNTWFSSGTYTDTILNTTNCDSIITINLIIMSSSSVIVDTVCQNYTSPSGNYIWTISGIYSDTLFGANSQGCDSIISINLTVYPSDVAAFIYATVNFCMTDQNPTPTITGTLFGTFSIDNNGVINSSTGQIDIINSGVGIFTVTYITSGNCPDTSSINVVINDCPPAINFSVSSNNLCVNDCINFTDWSASSTIGGIYSWLWTFNGADSTTSTEQNPTNICYTKEGVYSVTIAVADSNGVSTLTLQNYIFVVSCLEIIIPNFFTPNGDGKNDLFKFDGGNISKLHFMIYNRWGQLLFETNQINEGWNGRTTAGTICAEGTYFYLIDVEQNEENKLFKGAFSLLR